MTNVPVSGNTIGVLIVEDDRMAANQLQGLLSDLGYDPYAVAPSTEQAVWEASQRCPDVVLVKVGIKGTLDGVDAAELLRRRFGVPFVYLTTHADDVQIDRVKKSEPYGYLLKPVQSSKLRSVIELALHKHTTETQLRHADPEPRLEHQAAPARSTRRSTVLLADDHVVVREGLAKLLAEHDFEVVGAVGDGFLLLDAARQLRPDVIVTDISMPGLSGLDVLERLKAERLDSKVIVLTMHNDADLATRATRAGASGFLLKYSAGEELVGAIHQVLLGRVYLAPAVTKAVMERLAAPAESSRPTLTSRQLEVLRLVMEGYRMKEVAAALQLSTRTVETHKYEMMRTLGVSSVAELVKYAVEHRLIMD